MIEKEEQIWHPSYPEITAGFVHWPLAMDGYAIIRNFNHCVPTIKQIIFVALLRSLYDHILVLRNTFLDFILDLRNMVIRGSLLLAGKLLLFLG